MPARTGRLAVTLAAVLCLLCYPVFAADTSVPLVNGQQTPVPVRYHDNGDGTYSSTTYGGGSGVTLYADNGSGTPVAVQAGDIAANAASMAGAAKVVAGCRLNATPVVLTPLAYDGEQCAANGGGRIVGFYAYSTNSSTLGGNGSYALTGGALQGGANGGWNGNGAAALVQGMGHLWDGANLWKSWFTVNAAGDTNTGTGIAAVGPTLWDGTQQVRAQASAGATTGTQRVSGGGVGYTSVQANSTSQATLTITGTASKHTCVVSYYVDLVPLASAAAATATFRIRDTTSGTNTVVRLMGDGAGLETGPEHITFASPYAIQADTATGDNVNVEFAAAVTNYSQSVGVTYFQAATC